MNKRFKPNCVLTTNEKGEIVATNELTGIDYIDAHEIHTTIFGGFHTTKVENTHLNIDSIAGIISAKSFAFKHESGTNMSVINNGGTLEIGGDPIMKLRLKNVSLELPTNNAGIYDSGKDRQVIMARKGKIYTKLMWQFPPYEYYLNLNSDAKLHIKATIDDHIFNLLGGLVLSENGNSPFTITKKYFYCHVSGRFEFNLLFNLESSQTYECVILLTDENSEKIISKYYFDGIGKKSFNVVFNEIFICNTRYGLYLDCKGELDFKFSAKLNVTCQRFI